MNLPPDIHTTIVDLDSPFPEDEYPRVEGIAEIDGLNITAEYLGCWRIALVVNRDRQYTAYAIATAEDSHNLKWVLDSEGLPYEDIMLLEPKSIVNLK